VLSFRTHQREIDMCVEDVARAAGTILEQRS